MSDSYGMALIALWFIGATGVIATSRNRRRDLAMLAAILAIMILVATA